MKRTMNHYSSDLAPLAALSDVGRAEPVFSSGSHSRRSGIVLLVVLGMLTLFSMLAASYLVFTNQQRSAAASIRRAEVANVDTQKYLDDALSRLLVGGTGPDSSLWGHDLLGDLYGMRDGFVGTMPTSVANPIALPDVMLSGEFVRIPTNLHLASGATYPNRRGDTAAERRYPEDPTPEFNIDDELAGRILTFTTGPLSGLSMRIIRSFGDHSSPTTPNGREILNGQLVLDVRPHLGRSISVESLDETFTLAEWIRRDQLGSGVDFRDIGLLFYESVSPVGPVLSDFFVNGRILNGPGLGWDADRDATLTASGTFNLNETIDLAFNPTQPAPLAVSNVKSGANFANGVTGGDVPVALQGHYATYRRIRDAGVSGTTPVADAYIQDLPSGDTDEPYDAPDNQNWFLSYFPFDASLGEPIPSFVRPGVLNWIINQQPATDDLDSLSVNRLRQIIRALQRSSLRPIRIINDPTMPAAINNRADGVLQLDYSEFTGGNPSPLGTLTIDFASTNTTTLAGQIRQIVRSLAGRDVNGDGLLDWDVDNNGDGVPDGVWVDAGLPITQSDTGELIKPMVSYLVEDLGGRVNVNLAGNLAQANNRIVRNASGTLWRESLTGTPLGATPLLGAGFGYGPAEINLLPLFAHPSAQVGNGALNLLRRRLVSQTVSSVEYLAPGYLQDLRTGRGNDLPGALRQPFLPNLHQPNNAYGLPVDKFGRGSLSLGMDGGLMVSGTSAPLSNGGQAAGDSDDDPYEFEPFAGTLPDAALTLTDLEALLRFDDFDRDALDSELVRLTNTHFNDPTPLTPGVPTNTEIDSARREFAASVTTISNSAAMSTGPLPREYRDITARSTSAAPSQSLLTAEMPNGVLAAQERNALLMQLFPREVLAGHKLNLNRPFGNGIDDDGDGVVDDPQEVQAAIEVYYRNVTGGTTQTAYTTGYTDVTNGVPGPGNGPYEPSPQALFARHLYVMMMTLAQDNTPGATPFDFTYGQTITIPAANQTTTDARGGTGVAIASEQEEMKAMTIAQWAINVAEFRDPDGIMSRFDYDINPFNGWDIETIGGRPTFRTVWGMEYPELAIEESLAFHNRNVRDTALDSTLQERFDGTSFQDDDTDQWRLPQGSLFLELRPTRAPDQVRVVTSDTDPTARPWALPAELYRHVDIDGSGTINAGDEFAIDLANTAPDRNPIWRVAISKAHPGLDTVAGVNDPQLSPDEMLQPVGANAGANPYQLPAAQTAANRLTATLDPSRPNLFGPTVANAIERVVWFTNRNPDDGERADGSPGDPADPNGLGGDFTAGDNIVNFAPTDSQDIQRIFYNRFANTDYPYQINTSPGFDPVEVFARAGQHVVIGPRAITYVGSLQTHGTGGPTHDPTTDRPLVTYAQYESPQRLLLGAQSFEHRLISGSRSTPTVDVGGVDYASIRPVVGILAAVDAPNTWAGPAVVGTVQAVGLNVSEPLPTPTGVSYYNNPTQRLRAGFPRDSWYDFDASTGVLPDQPFDEQGYAELFQVFDINGVRTGTRERFKTAFLQRLADPTRAYNVNTNPYLTIDYITIDLTVFNGAEDNRQETETGPPAVTEWIDLNDPDPLNQAPDERFATRYKTGKALDVNHTSATEETLSHGVNTFPPVLTPATIASEMNGHVPFFDRTLNLADAVNPDDTTIPAGAIAKVDTYAPRTTHSSSLGYANTAYGERTRQPAPASGGPSLTTGLPYNDAFTTATWLNRSYVSPGELAWVPSTSAGRFTAHFGTATTGTDYTAGNWYEGTNSAVGNRRETNRVYPYLFNMFAQNPDFQQTPNLWRIMEWVEVPAPFDYENDFITTNNNLLSGSAPLGNVGQSPMGAVLNYNAFGTAPITANPNTWSSVNAAFWMNNWMEESFRAPNNILQPDFRQGKINLNTIKSVKVYQALMSLVTPEGTDPPEGAFFNEFIASRRGYTTGTPGGELIQPLTVNQFHREHPSTMAGAFRPSSVSDISEVAVDRVDPLNRTMMRPQGTAGAYGNDPLFVRPTGAATTAPQLWRDRSVAIQQQPLTRLNNLASDQSNVFAVWITVGLFEVDGSTNQVQDEVGASLGQSRRYRAFHIIDRSVPVRYQPGQLNNAMDTVQLSRTLN